MSSPNSDNIQSDLKWFVLRDLKRANAKNRAWEVLSEKGYEVFTPLHWKLITKNGGKRLRKQVPVVYDLLFVHSSRKDLDPEIQRSETLQYRFVKGCGGRPMEVSPAEMQKFIRAVSDSETVKYYTPAEITHEMKGRMARIIGGPLHGYEGKLLSVRGSKVRRLVVELPGLITAAVEVNPEYINFIEDAKN